MPLNYGIFVVTEDTDKKRKITRGLEILEEDWNRIESFEELNEIPLENGTVAKYRAFMFSGDIDKPLVSPDSMKKIKPEKFFELADKYKKRDEPEEQTM